MSYQVLARKWRPGNFRQMVGQEHVLQALVNALDSGRLHHAYLFSGTRGVGKTTIARIFAKSLNCEKGITSEPCGQCSSCVEIDEGRSVDLIEIDAASRTGVDDMRELLDNVQYAPTRGRFKVYLIDEVHMLSRQSFNALLKSLEEPPPHIKFLLATTDPQKIPVTVLSRCLQFNLKRMSRAQIMSQLQYLTEQEQIEAEPAALTQLAAAADGSMRDALSLLDQTIAYGGGAVLHSAVESMLGSISRDYLIKLFDALMQQDAVLILREARAIIENSPDFQRVCAEMIAMLQDTALFQSDPSLATDDEFDLETLQKYSSKWSAEEIQLFYQILLQGRQDLLICPDEAAGFEMLMLRLLAFSPAGETVQEQAEIKKKPVARVPSEPPQRRRQEPLQTQDNAVVDLKKDDSIDWSSLAYNLGLDGLAQEIVANSVLESFHDGYFKLNLSPEIYGLANASVESEISEVLKQRFGVSLNLQLISMQTLEKETPLQVSIEQQQQERLEAIEAIKQEDVFKKLHHAFSAELDEASVSKIEN